MGIEEVVYMVKAKDHESAIQLAKNYAKENQSIAKDVEDWNIIPDLGNVNSFEIFELNEGDRTDVQEVYSNIFHNRRSITKAVKDLLGND